MKDYLRQLQMKELEILKEIAAVCDKLNLKYSIFYGTLLGAIRHKGFIPWDDDIDIIMPREDYDIFVSEAQKYFPEQLFLQHYTTEPNTMNLYVKIRDKNTLFLEADNQNLNICHGIFIDVFPFDRCMGGEKKIKREFYRRKIFNLITECYSRNALETITNPLKKGLGYIVNMTFCKLISIKSLIEKEDYRRKALNKKGDDCYLLDFYAFRGTATYDEIFDVEKVVFEKCEFYGSKHYDKIMRQLYGEYMKLPPLEKRITHKPLEVKFDLKEEK